MPRRLLDIIKVFEFTRETREDLDLSGGLRCLPGDLIDGPARIELPGTATGYDTDDTLTAVTWTFNPLSVKEWRGFQAVIEHIYNDDGDPLTFARYRVSDGTTTYWWDGAVWTAVVAATDWNTEEQVAANISTFPLTARSIRFVINLYTTDETVTPKLTALKLLYGSDVQHQEDYITRSLIPTLKENIRIIGRVIVAQVTTGTTITLPALETPYDVVDVDSVFDEAADPNHLVDLLDSYNSGTREITLNTSIAEDTNLFIQFVYRPMVAHRTSRDFDEVDRVPSIGILDVSYVGNKELKDDTVINRGAGTGVKVFGGKMRDIEMTIQVIADKLVDYQRLIQAVTEHFTANTLLRARGIDEEFSVMVVEPPSMMTAVNSNDTHAGQLRVRILNAVFLERGSTEVFTVTRFNMVGERPGYHSLRVIIS